MQRDHSQHQHHQVPNSDMASERIIPAPKKKSLLQRTRSKSFPGLTVHLSLQIIQTILGKVLPLCGQNERAVCEHFLSTLTESQLDNRQQMEELKFFLKDRLASQRISSLIVADIHSCIGLIQGKLGHTRPAILSLMNALWIQQKIELADGDVVKALTEHRLAHMYAQVQEYDSAISLVEKAYNTYAESKMKADHEVFQDAEDSMRTFRLKLLEMKMVQRGTFHSTALSVVDEGSSSASKSTNSSPKQIAAIGA